LLTNENAEYTQELVEMINSYKKLMYTLLINREKISILWSKTNLIKPNIIGSAYNPSSTFIGIGFKSDQA
jgi:hypothetical protein